MLEEDSRRAASVAKTAKLRELRLAKEAEERASTPNKVKPAPRKTRWRARLAIHAIGVPGRWKFDPSQWRCIICKQGRRCSASLRSMRYRRLEPKGGRALPPARRKIANDPFAVQRGADCPQQYVSIRVVSGSGRSSEARHGLRSKSRQSQHERAGGGEGRAGIEFTERPPGARLRK